LPFVVVSSLLTFAAFGLYAKWWRYVTQRDYNGIVEAVVIAALLLPGYVALAHPVTQSSAAGATPVTAPTGVLALYFLLMLTVFELLQTGGNVVRQVRDVQVEDILGREPVRMELDRVGAYLNTEVVMVTGAGGSIGKELSRQIARVAPRRLVLLDHAEDNLFQ